MSDDNAVPASQSASKRSDDDFDVTFRGLRGTFLTSDDNHASSPRACTASDEYFDVASRGSSPISDDDADVIARGESPISDDHADAICR